MRYLIRLTAVVFAIGVLSGALPSAAQETTAACASAVWLEPMAGTPAPNEVAPAAEGAPDWLTAELTDACSGQPFALADFAGKVLFIEPMATWCTNCHGQLTRLKEAAARIPVDERADVVLVALSSEVGLPHEDLAAYAEKNDFPFLFAVMPAEMLRAMAEDLGQEVAVPPAMPHLIVTPGGTIGELHTGAVSPDDLLAQFAEASQQASS